VRQQRLRELAEECGGHERFAGLTCAAVKEARDRMRVGRVDDDIGFDELASELALECADPDAPVVADRVREGARNRAVNQHIGIDSNERRDQSAEALEQAIDSIEEIADQVQEDLAVRVG
jgi:hypothetical protein